MWLAYSSDESGTPEIYVQSYPEPGGKWQVSRGGGRLPAWRADGRELFYLGPEDLMFVAVSTGESFRHDAPVALFELPEMVEFGWVSRTFDAMPDGERFLLMTPWKDEHAVEPTITLVQGWRRLLE